MIEIRAAATLLILLSVACAPPRRVALPGSAWRVASVEASALMLSPPVSQLPVRQPLSVRFKVAPASKHDRGRVCEVTNDLFAIKISRKAREAVFTMPSLEKWAAALPYWELPESRELEEKVAMALGAPEALEQRGCLRPDSALVLRQLLRDSIPVRLGDDLYPAYGYRAGGIGLDLIPGVRLRIQRAYFGKPAPNGGRPSLRDLLGTTTVVYDCESDTRSRVTFRRGAIDYGSNNLKDGLGEGVQDANLATLLQPMRMYRLLLLTTYVSKGIRRSAMIVGSSSLERLLIAEREIAANPAESCSELVERGDLVCVPFEGDVSVSAQMQVDINGKSAYVDWGTSVRSLLAASQAQPVAPERIRLERRFQGKLVPVEIDPGTRERVKDIVLVGGDRLSWF